MPMMPGETIQPGAPAPTQGAMGGAPAPSLASSPAQSSALGGSPVGLSGSPDPKAILAKAELLLKSGAISQAQFQMIIAKLQGGGAAPPKPGMPPGPGGAPPSPLTTSGTPGAGPAMGQPQGPSPQWNV